MSISDHFRVTKRSVGLVPPPRDTQAAMIRFALFLCRLRAQFGDTELIEVLTTELIARTPKANIRDVSLKRSEVSEEDGGSVDELANDDEVMDKEGESEVA